MDQSTSKVIGSILPLTTSEMRSWLTPSFRQFIVFFSLIVR